MRSLAKKYSKVFASLFAGVLLTVCSFAAVSAHQPSSTTTDIPSCSASCHAHNQAVGGTGIAEKDEDDDKEPVPPLAHWLQGFSDLASLYVAPILAIVPIALLRKKLILSTQLRI